MNPVWFFFLNIDIPFLRIDTVSPNKISRYSRVSIFSYTPSRDMPQNESTDKGNYRTETTLFFNHSLEQGFSTFCKLGPPKAGSLQLGPQCPPPPQGLFLMPACFVSRCLFNLQGFILSFASTSAHTTHWGLRSAVTVNPNCRYASSYLRSFFAAGGASVGLLVLTRNFSIFVMCFQ